MAEPRPPSDLGPGLRAVGSHHAIESAGRGPATHDHAVLGAGRSDARPCVVACRGGRDPADALQANDAPQTDAGIAQTWAFAHPDNKRITGPLPRFTQMIEGPLYRILLNHRSHEVKEVSRTDDEAVFAVTVTTQTGEVFGYRWSVAKVADGENAGAWMTIAVSPPVPAGEAI
jgi:hypothetical protein